MHPYPPHPTIPRPPAPARSRRRLRLPRRLPPFWMATAALAVITGLTVARLLGLAAADVARYGELTPTLVATRDVPAGARLGPGDAEVRRIPAALVPAGALSAAPDGSPVVIAPVHRGEAVLAGRLAPSGLSETAALLPPGTRGIAIPLGPDALALRWGDRVDVLATVDAAMTETTPEPTFPVARGATVVAVEGESVTVAVTPAEARRVAFAVTTGAVTLLLAGQPAPSS